MPLLRRALDRLKRRRLFRPLRLANLTRRSRLQRPDWSRLLTDSERASLKPRDDAPRVLISTSVGLHLVANAADSAFAAALLARGAAIDVLLCDAAVPACQAGEANWFPDLSRFAANGVRDMCAGCFAPAAKMFSDLPVRVRRYSEFLTDEDRAWAKSLAAQTISVDVPGLVVDGIPIGEHAMSGTLRFFARGVLAAEPFGDEVVQQYLEASLLSLRVGQRLFREGNYTAAVFHHGIYVPQGILAAAARVQGTRVVTWNMAYRQRSFIFSHDDTYHRTLMDEPEDSWAALPWTTRLDEELAAYLVSRAGGGKDWVSFYREAEGNFDRIAGEFGIVPDKPIVLLLTNVVWDAQLHYPGNAFPTMLDWLFTTIEQIGRRPDLQLVIRVHPAEITGALPSRQRVVDELKRRFATLPANVIVIPPDSPASSYAIAARSNVALIYASRMGVELAAAGLPVIAAGEAWVRNKGITSDVRSADHYRQLLDALPMKERLFGRTLERARKYAYHFFFRRMIPVNVFEPRVGWPPLDVRIQNSGQLRLGGDAGLDVICDGILRGAPFVYPAERANQTVR